MVLSVEAKPLYTLKSEVYVKGDSIIEYSLANYTLAAMAEHYVAWVQDDRPVRVFISPPDWHAKLYAKSRVAVSSLVIPARLDLSVQHYPKDSNNIK